MKLLPEGFKAAHDGLQIRDRSALGGANPSLTFLPRRVWNGIFDAGDRRAKKGPKTISPRRDRKSETTTHEKSAHNILKFFDLAGVEKFKRRWARGERL